MEPAATGRVEGSAHPIGALWTSGGVYPCRDKASGSGHLWATRSRFRERCGHSTSFGSAHPACSTRLQPVRWYLATPAKRGLSPYPQGDSPFLIGFVKSVRKKWGLARQDAVPVPIFSERSNGWHCTFALISCRSGQSTTLLKANA